MRHKVESSKIFDKGHRNKSALVRLIRVMITSRNVDRLPDVDGPVTLSEVRKQLQEELSKETFCGQKLLEVWINEEAGAEAGDSDAWDTCLTQVDKADVVIAIYNGNAGWSKDKNGMGICHAELERALARYPARVRLIRLRFSSDKSSQLISPDEVSQSNDANRSFAAFIERSNLFSDFPTDRKTLCEKVRIAVAKAVADFADHSRREMQKGKFYLGTPLDWSRLSYIDRKLSIERAVNKYLLRTRAENSKHGLTVLFDSGKVILKVHGVPSSFGIAEARELVGRPYLEDYRLFLDGARNVSVGPLHIIACHKQCTEPQIVSFMGHPDLFIVHAPFGFFVADQSSFVQTFFLVNCRDETSTQANLQNMFDWTNKSNEEKRLYERAMSRTAILRTIARETKKVSRKQN